MVTCRRSPSCCFFLDESEGREEWMEVEESAEESEEREDGVEEDSMDSLETVDRCVRVVPLDFALRCVRFASLDSFNSFIGFDSFI